MSAHRLPWLVALLCCSGLFVYTSQVHAIPEKSIRKFVKSAEQLERERNWEAAREIYEALLGQTDPGLKIRDRYNNVLRRCRQVRRHQDSSYRGEVLSIDYGKAMWLHKIISKTLLDGSVDKEKVDATKLFHKGMEEFDAALTDPFFLKEYVPAAKHGEVAAFRALLRKHWGDKANMSREEAAKQVAEVAAIAARDLHLKNTVVVMEFACGACYAIDEYTAYLTPNQLRQLVQSLSRIEAIGVGMSLGIRDNRIVIQGIAPNSPAADQPDETNRINVGDQIISVNKKSVVDLPLQSVKEMLEGPVGSMVDIEILTPGQSNVRLIRLARERAIVPSVIAFPFDKTGYGYLKINRFTETTVDDVDEALRSLFQEKPMKGLILDLRENHGGLFESAIDTARRFLSKGIITSTAHRDAKHNLVYQANDPNALAAPMVLLVDGDTASAAEVLAGALKDNNRAYLIGQTTFGKGCTQCLLELPEARKVPTGGMKLTVARFFSPKGISYSGRGVVPHFIIEERMSSSESMGMRGPYFDKAIEELNRMTAMQK